jgi:recombination protein RecR
MVMNNSYPKALLFLLDELEKLPGVGPKSAQRLAYHLLGCSKEEASMLAKAIMEAREKIRFCVRCFNFSEEDLCPVCMDESRDHSIICVVEEPKDLAAMERTREFKGVYHVLHGVISPLDGVNPEALKIKELLHRLKREEVKEVVIATNPNIEGETTAMYIAKLIKPLGVKVTRLASGLPVGGDLDYVDEVTLGRALEARREIE